MNKKRLTIAELLIVIAAIAILAAVVIVSYNNVQNRAVESKVMQEVSKISKKISHSDLHSGKYSLSQETSVGINPYDTEYPSRYFQRDGGSGFCIDVRSTKMSEIQYYFDTKAKTVRPGLC